MDNYIEEQDVTIKPEYMAVYGALRTGYGNNVYLEDEQSMGMGLLHGFKLYTMDAVGSHRHDSIPFMCADDSGADVAVEVFTAPDDLRAVDSLEGHPAWYRRVLVNVKLATGTIVPAWSYLFSEDLRQDYEARNSCNPVPTGDWTKPVLLEGVG